MKAQRWEDTTLILTLNYHGVREVAGESTRRVFIPREVSGTKEERERSLQGVE